MQPISVATEVPVLVWLMPMRASVLAHDARPSATSAVFQFASTGRQNVRMPKNVTQNDAQVRPSSIQMAIRIELCDWVAIRASVVHTEDLIRATVTVIHRC